MDNIQLQILLRVAVAMILGALIGIDREAADKPAGLRTHILVTGVGAILISIGELIGERDINLFGDEIVGVNPSRIVAAIITGISFLGAGTIIRNRSRSEIEGLTTAASLLFASVVGMSVALSQWILAIGGTILVLINLRLLPWLEEKIRSIWE